MAQTGKAFDPAAPLLGEVVGRHRLVQLLGEGGMGSVYRGVHVDLGLQRAVKMMRPEIAAQADLRRRFFREARVLAKIRHPRVVEAIEVAPEEAVVPFLVMRLEEGVSLADALADISTRGAAQEIREIMIQTLEGLAAAHAQGIVHRDVKPENILLRRWDGEERKPDLVLIDFGLGKPTAGATADDPEQTGVTRGGMVSGTPAYMAPEQIRPGEAVDARTDLYSVGCVFYELCTGEAPFAAEAMRKSPDTTARSIAHMLAHLSTPPPAPIVRPDPRFGPIIARLLAKDPAARYQNADEVIAALTAVDLNPKPVVVRTQKSSSRWMVWVSAGFLVVLAIAATTAFGPWHRPTETSAPVSTPIAVPAQAPPPAVAPTPEPEPAPPRVPSLYEQCVASLARADCEAYCVGADASGKLEIKIRHKNAHKTAPSTCR